jgi:hypothetical protein
MMKFGVREKRMAEKPKSPKTTNAIDGCKAKPAAAVLLFVLKVERAVICEVSSNGEHMLVAVASTGDERVVRSGDSYIWVNRQGKAPFSPNFRAEGEPPPPIVIFPARALAVSIVTVAPDAIFTTSPVSGTTPPTQVEGELHCPPARVEEIMARETGSSRPGRISPEFFISEILISPDTGTSRPDAMATEAVIISIIMVNILTSFSSTKKEEQDRNSPDGSAADRVFSRYRTGLRTESGP